MEPEAAPSPEQPASEQPAAPVEPAKGLPPVTPPSGRHIVQLFVVPGLIVGLVILIFLGCSGVAPGISDWVLGISHSPTDYLDRLASPNPDVRWRAANDLAQVLKRDDGLASDPRVALRLTELLNQELDDFDRDERSFKERSAKMSKEERTKEENALKERREKLRFLSSCLGNLTVPVGAVALAELAAKGKGNDPKTRAMLRRHAVWMLANLGNNLKRFKNLPAERQAEICGELAKEAKAGGPQGQLAQRTLDYLKDRKELGVIAALASCAGDDDPDLRTLVAFALTFWEGTAAENVQAEEALLRLSSRGERGEGARILLGEKD